MTNTIDPLLYVCVCVRVCVCVCVCVCAMLTICNIMKEILNSVGEKRLTPDDHFIEYDTYRPPVHGMASTLSQDKLRGNVLTSFSISSILIMSVVRKDIVHKMSQICNYR